MINEREKTMKQVQYIEYRDLECRGPVDPGQPEPIEGSLLVGAEPVLSFEDHVSSYGEDSSSIFPAFYNGVRAWVRRDVWSPAYGYSASGTQESILSFEDGVLLFLGRGVFEFPEPVPAPEA
jgi:hypothetical protein